MNICVMAELQTALKDLLVYNLEVNKSEISKAGQGPAFDLCSENYLEILKFGKENVFEQFPQSWSVTDDLKKALSDLLKSSSVEK